jgi:hypothetical protein
MRSPIKGLFRDPKPEPSKASWSRQRTDEHDLEEEAELLAEALGCVAIYPRQNSHGRYVSLCWNGPDWSDEHTYYGVDDPRWRAMVALARRAKELDRQLLAKPAPAEGAERMRIAVWLDDYGQVYRAEAVYGHVPQGYFGDAGHPTAIVVADIAPRRVLELEGRVDE